MAEPFQEQGLKQLHPWPKSALLGLRQCCLLTFSAQVCAGDLRFYSFHLMGHREVTMSLLMLTPLCQRLIANLFTQFDHGIKNGFRTGRATGEIEVNWNQLVNATDSLSWNPR
jgi:hypothetical protein